MTFQELFERIKSWALGVFAKGADLDGKQNTISDLSDIRRGAGLGATAYQKPSGGIPATDLADGVIPDVPTVPTISTDISADAASDTKTASPKAVKDYVDGHSSPDAVKYVSQELTSGQQAQARTNIGAVSTADLADTNEAIRNGLSDLSSDISDLDDAIQAVDRGEYVTAWDGASAPVVADIPAGVQVEYSSQTYTGELAASASTLNKIYLVGTGTTDEYDRYITSRSGTEGSYTYAWVPLGSTEITLSDYATNAKVSQLEAKVFGFDGPVDLSQLPEETGIIAESQSQQPVWSLSGGTCCFLPVNPGQEYTITANANFNTNYVFLKQSGVGEQYSTPDFASGYSGRITLLSGESAVVIAPADALVLYIRKTSSNGGNMLPSVSTKVGGLEKRIEAELDNLEVEVYGGGGDWVKKDLSTLSVITGGIASGEFWSNSGTSVLLPVTPGQKFKIVGSQNNGSNFTFLAGNTLVDHTAPNFAAGYNDRIVLSAEEVSEVTAPNNAVSMWIRETWSNGTECLPDVYVSDNIGLVKRVENLEENGVASSLNNIISIKDAQSYDIAIGASQNWLTGIGKCILFPVCPGWKYKIVSNENYNTHLAILAQSIPGANNESVSFATGFTDRVIVEAGGNSYTFVAPDDAVCLYLRLTDSYGADMKPDAVYTDNDGDILLKGTFQSSFNETDTESIREKVGGIINGKNEIETFLFFTDPHLTPNSRYESMNEFLRDKYISILQKYYNSLPLDTVICGGDWLNFDHTNKEAAGWLGYCDGYMRKLFRNYLPVFGNHDNNPYNPDTSSSNWLKALTYVDIRNLMFRENKLTYYSHEAVNTRFYILNSGVSFIKTMTNSDYSRLVSNRWPQVDWLGQKLLSEDPAHGVIVLHIYSNATNESEWFSNATGYWAKGIHAFGANVKAMALAYNNRQSITLNGNTYDFSNCEGNIAFIMCGHTHFDYVDTSEELPIVCCTNLEGGYLDGSEVKYTLEPTFDNCVVDYDNGVLYMVRVGAAKSRIVHFATQSLSAGSTLELDTELTGTVTWASRDNAKATVSNGTVTGVASGIVGIKASDDTTEEYWIIKVS